MAYRIEEIAIGDLGFVFRCDCGFKYLSFNHEENFRDWHNPEGRTTQECFACGVPLLPIYSVRRWSSAR